MNHRSAPRKLAGHGAHLIGEGLYILGGAQDCPIEAQGLQADAGPLHDREGDTALGLLYRGTDRRVTQSARRANALEIEFGVVDAGGDVKGQNQMQFHLRLRPGRCR